MAIQADSHSTIPKSPVRGTGKALVLSTIRRAVASAQTLFGLEVIEESQGKTILIPICDDNFAPALCCGEFAIVDTRNTRLEDGVLVYRRDGLRGCRGSDPTRTQSLSIVEVRIPSARMAEGLSDDDERHPPPYWYIALGWTRVWGNPDIFRERGIPVRNGRIPMGDGVISEKNLQPMIVGRVIGVLGNEGRSLKWRAA